MPKPPLPINPNNRTCVYILRTPCGHHLEVVATGYIRFASPSGDNKIDEASYSVELNGIPVGQTFDSRDWGGHDGAENIAKRHLRALAGAIQLRVPAPPTITGVVDLTHGHGMRGVVA